MSSARVLLLYSPAGGGHRAAASAIAGAIAATGAAAGSGASIEIRDVLEFAPRWFRYDRAWSLVQAHGGPAWDWLFDVTDGDTPLGIDELRLPLHRALFAGLDRHLEQTRPTHVVSTHYLPAIAVARRRRRGLAARALTVVTDHQAHQAWATPGVDGYCVADAAVARAMARRAPGAEVRVTGIPVDRAAAAPVRAVDEWLARPKLLVLLSGVPVAQALAAIAALAPLGRGAARLHVLCGGEPAVQQAAAAALAGTDAVVAARAPTLLPLIDQADLVVTKAGGLVVSECLARGRAMLLPFAAPGQERGNLFHALAVGAAARPSEIADSGALVRALASEPGRLRRMGARARLASRPDAADAVARCLFEAAVAEREGRRAA